MVKQKRIALKTFDDKTCYIDKNNSVPWEKKSSLLNKDGKHSFEPFRFNKWLREQLIFLKKNL